ncbi:alpha 1,2-mannosyltransferase [Nematocida major]|uniref:alpha 1,2-mannosyltransferase n=1 Tax=Nematocida major TaxID=1912982 RepID=UPI002008155D|nr:alpha 1,2-mannosyltransferase [Nematocida major]KAH9386942.1 alpha 1,2-mannosyltransferase [Nematocida major]
MLLEALLCFFSLAVQVSLQKESACIFILCRNSDIDAIKETVSVFEQRFNRKFGYPYVVVNDVEFTDDFKREFSALTKASVEFGRVPEEHWSTPKWIDKGRAKESMRRLESAQVIYGGSESYRHMCRYFSGFFFQHPLTLKYRYYWRIEPETRLHCDIEYDVFEYMRVNRKKYGFTITLHEYPQTVTSLWSTIQKFVSSYNTFFKEGEYWTLLEPLNLHRFITDEMHTRYNMCHFWSNFEVGDFSFFRGKKYRMLFEYLDKSGGFFYERWGDAPIHSIAAALFLRADEIHYFEDIGYTHPPFTHCPKPSLQKTHCNCTPSTSVDLSMPLCINLFRKTVKMLEKSVHSRK